MKRLLMAATLVITAFACLGMGQDSTRKIVTLNRLKESIQRLQQCHRSLPDPMSYPNIVRKVMKEQGFTWQQLETNPHQVDGAAQMCSGLKSFEYRTLMRLQKEGSPLKRDYAQIMYRAVMDAQWPLKILVLTDDEIRLVEEVTGTKIVAKTKPKR